MGSPFKMSPKTPLMKALVGKQKNLPEHLKQAILDAPAKMIGSSKRKRGTGVEKNPRPLTPEQKANVAAQNAQANANAKRTGRGTGLIKDPRAGKKTDAKSPAKMTDDKKKGKTVDINKPVKNPQPGTEAYAKQERAAGKGSKYFTKEGLDVTPSEKTKKMAAERRKQKAEARRKRLGIKTAY